MFKLFFFVFSLQVALFIPNQVLAAQTVAEKAKVATNDTARAIKKGAHRVEETFCMEGNLKCAGKKASNRAVEAKDAMVDGASEVKEKLD